MAEKIGKWIDATLGTPPSFQTSKKTRQKWLTDSSWTGPVKGEKWSGRIYQTKIKRRIFPIGGSRNWRLFLKRTK